MSPIVKCSLKAKMGKLQCLIKYSKTRFAQPQQIYEFIIIPALSLDINLESSKCNEIYYWKLLIWIDLQVFSFWVSGKLFVSFHMSNQLLLDYSPWQPVKCISEFGWLVFRIHNKMPPAVHHHCKYKSGYRGWACMCVFVRERVETHTVTCVNKFRE
jgi:hypothetical protein